MKMCESGCSNTAMFSVKDWISLPNELEIEKTVEICGGCAEGIPKELLKKLELPIDICQSCKAKDEIVHVSKIKGNLCEVCLTKLHKL